MGMCSIAMPFHRRKFRARRRPRRRRGRRFRGRRTFRRRRVMLDPERKSVENNVNNQVLFSTGFILPLNLVDQGVTETERIGRQMLCVSNLISYTLTINLTSIFPVEIRTALILFKQPNGVALNIAEIWDSVGAGSLAVVGHRDLFNVRRYKILWTNTHRLSPAKQTLITTKFKPLRVVTLFDNAVGATANLQTGALWFVAQSTTNLTANAPTITVDSRTRYVG